MNSTLCCNSKPNPPLSFFLSHSLHTTVRTHTHTNNLLPLTLPPTLPLSSRPLGLWSSGVRWVGGLVGGSWGWRAERAGIQSNMHREITIAPLGDLQMLAAQGIVVGSYHRSNTSWETTHPAYRSAFTLLISAAFSFSLHLLFTVLRRSGKLELLLLPYMIVTLKKSPFKAEERPFLITGCLQRRGSKHVLLCT